MFEKMAIKLQASTVCYNFFLSLHCLFGAGKMFFFVYRFVILITMGLFASFSGRSSLGQRSLAV